jgi:hypothetical protein
LNLLWLDSPLSGKQPSASGEVMEIDSTPLDVLARYLYERTGEMIGSLPWLIRSAAIPVDIASRGSIRREGSSRDRPRIPRRRSVLVQAVAKRPTTASAAWRPPTTCPTATSAVTSAGIARARRLRQARRPH